MHDFSFSFFLNLNLSFRLQFFFNRCLSDSKRQQLNCSGLEHPLWRVPLPPQERHSVMIRLSAPPTVWPESRFPAFLRLAFLSQLCSLAMRVSSLSPNKHCFCPCAFAHPLPFRCNAPTSEQLPSNKKTPTVRPPEISSVLGSHLCSTSNAWGSSPQCHPYCILHRLRII